MSRRCHFLITRCMRLNNILWRFITYRKQILFRIIIELPTPTLLIKVLWNQLRSTVLKLSNIRAHMLPGPSKLVYQRNKNPVIFPGRGNKFAGFLEKTKARLFPGNNLYNLTFFVRAEGVNKLFEFYRINLFILCLQWNKVISLWKIIYLFLPKIVKSVEFNLIGKIIIAHGRSKFSKYVNRHFQYILSYYIRIFLIYYPQENLNDAINHFYRVLI